LLILFIDFVIVSLFALCSAHLAKFFLKLLPYLSCNHRKPAALLIIRFSGCLIVIIVGCNCLFWKTNMMIMMMMMMMMV